MKGVVLRPVMHRGRRTAALVFPYSRMKMALRFIGCLAFVLVGATMIYAADEIRVTAGSGPLAARVIGIITVVFFGATAVALLMSRFGRDRGVMLLPQGLAARELLGYYFAPWDAIKEVALYTVKRRAPPLGYPRYTDWGPFLGLRLTNPGALSMSIPLWVRQCNPWSWGYQCGFQAGWDLCLMTENFAAPVALLEQVLQ